ncbi:protein kinase domain-containing protein [Methanoplanus limicola]|uniref:Serine/threonine protein kinase n=1 Tax=Methanoplanus limicola DSM 2279 TaxID=937775 RepID=H1Z279_9EURY|nr:serine/threonine protein kinase [Methanoplanus limicola]EHQ34608.1 serine/threonine protein kinase [Methanoplanus limicola DSM 2279]
MDKTFVYDRKGIKYTLIRPPRKGGEGEVFRLSENPALCAKIYYRNVITEEICEKITSMTDNPPAGDLTEHNKKTRSASIAWPLSELYKYPGRKDFCGFLMPVIDTELFREAHMYYDPEDRSRYLSGSFTWKYLLTAAYNIACTVSAIHKSGHCIGDMSGSNILVARTAAISVIDCDSFQIENKKTGKKFFTKVATGDYLAPELMGINFRTENIDRYYSDLFSLSILIFKFLMNGVHPFQARGKGVDDYPTTEHKIKNGIFPYLRNVRQIYPPLYAPPYAILPPEIRALFERCFVKGIDKPYMRPDAEEWVKVLQDELSGLKQCCNNPNHWHSGYLQVCPWCEILKIKKKEYFPYNGPKVVKPESGAVENGAGRENPAGEPAENIKKNQENAAEKREPDRAKDEKRTYATAAAKVPVRKIPSETGIPPEKEKRKTVTSGEKEGRVDSDINPSSDPENKSTPICPPPKAADNPVTDNPVTGNPVTDNPATDNPVTDNPVTGNPVTITSRIKNTAMPDTGKNSAAIKDNTNTAGDSRQIKDIKSTYPKTPGINAGPITKTEKIKTEKKKVGKTEVGKTEVGKTETLPEKRETALLKPEIIPGAIDLKFDPDCDNKAEIEIINRNEEPLEITAEPLHRWIILPEKGFTVIDRKIIEITVDRSHFEGIIPGIKYKSWIRFKTPAGPERTEINVSLQKKPLLTIITDKRLIFRGIEKPEKYTSDDSQKEYAQNIEIINSGERTLKGEITSDKNWIAAEPESFSIKGKQEINITIIPEHMSDKAIQTGKIAVISNGGRCEIQVIASLR